MIPSHIKALILDMDGVLWKADAPIGDLPAIFRRIRERGLKYVFATNNGTKTPEEYQQKLAELGVEIDPSQMVTSAMGVAFMLAKQFPKGTKVYVIGEEGVHAALRAEGFQVLAIEEAAQAEVFVMGIDRTITFQKMM